MNKAHAIKLSPTKSQELFFRKSCGTARFAFNWALNKWQEELSAKQKYENLLAALREFEQDNNGL